MSPAILGRAASGRALASKRQLESTDPRPEGRGLVLQDAKHGEQAQP